MSVRPLALGSLIHNARIERRRAAERCPHWDYDGDGDGHACCDELDEAERRLHELLAREARP